MRLLARREHSRRELRRKLGERGFGAERIEGLLDQLALEGLQSDARFAEAFVHYRAEKGYGPVRIIHELRERGVEDALAEQCVVTGAAEWSERAIRARVKRFGADRPADAAGRARQMRFLQYRGFTSGQIRSALEYERQ